MVANNPSESDKISTVIKIWIWVENHFNTFINVISNNIFNIKGRSKEDSLVLIHFES